MQLCAMHTLEADSFFKMHLVCIKSLRTTLLEWKNNNTLCR